MEKNYIRAMCHQISPRMTSNHALLDATGHTQNKMTQQQQENCSDKERNTYICRSVPAFCTMIVTYFVIERNDDEIFEFPIIRMYVLYIHEIDVCCARRRTTGTIAGTTTNNTEDSQRSGGYLLHELC